MTPQERQRVADLFDRLARLQSAPREREAEQAISEGVQRAPNALYALTQTVLIQEEALIRANQRIQELEAQAENTTAPEGGSFLDGIRGAFGGNAGTPRRVSVPSTRGPSGPMGVPPGFRKSATPAQQEIGRGGSFLGQAASMAAGVVVGSMVVDALRGQFGAQIESANAQQASTETEPQADQAMAQQDQAAHEDASYETADNEDSGGFDSGGFDGGFDVG